jgi:hypothetical protein
MADAKFRVKSKTEYVIEVNDKGETISFDLTDPRLPVKLIETYHKLEDLTKDFDNKVDEINARKDEEFLEFVTKNQYDVTALTATYFEGAVKTMDNFLGEGSCNKIFGEKRYLNMFNDLFELLMPEFDKMGVNVENLKKNLKNKYAPVKRTVLK